MEYTETTYGAYCSRREKRCNPYDLIRWKASTKDCESGSGLPSGAPFTRLWLSSGGTACYSEVQKFMSYPQVSNISFQSQTKPVTDLDIGGRVDTEFAACTK